MERDICEVSYQIASYSGTVTVYCDPDDDNETIEAKALVDIRRKAGGTLPFGSQSLTITSREPYDGRYEN